MKNNKLQEDARRKLAREDGKMPLSLLCEGEGGLLDAISPEHPLYDRLRDMGWRAGERVTCVRYSPSGDPIAYRVCGVTAALRVRDAERILVLPENGEALPECAHTRRKRRGRQDPTAEKPYTIALVGNPNVGKSTLFNSMTGMRRHTGNWTGKTLDRAAAFAKGKGRRLRMIDLPGMYGCCRAEYSTEEAAAVEYLESGEADMIAVVCDAGALARNLVLVLGVLRTFQKPTVLILNLQREARAHGVSVDVEALQTRLGIPVLCVEADERADSRRLCAQLRELSKMPQPHSSERSIPEDAHTIAREVVRYSEETARAKKERTADRFLTGRYTGALVMLALLALVFWVTMVGANACSEWLAAFFGVVEQLLWDTLGAALPQALAQLLLDGVVRTVFWVVAVMLPPMALFFPMFTILEDLGYLPRVAFNLDRSFARCSACGKQALTMCMGIGCNAVGVTGCRIIESARERKLAYLTCGLMPCNGRLPTLCTLISVFFVARNDLLGGLLSAGYLLGCLLLCVGTTFLSARLLSCTLLRGEPSSFVLELPPFRKPRWGQIAVRSVLDRTVRILCRAVAVAAPAGALLWLCGRIPLGDGSILDGLVWLLEIPGHFLGLDGVILAAFLLALPANEIAVPIMLMLYRAGGTLEQLGEWGTVKQLLLENGWTRVTVVCVILFMLFHWPCATALWTLRRESGSWKTTLLGALIPTAWGCILCFVVNLLSRVLAG